MKKIYVIFIIGCDDTTAFPMGLDDTELKLVKALCEKSKQFSEYSCMPVMEVEEFNEKDTGHWWYEQVKAAVDAEDYI